MLKYRILLVDDDLLSLSATQMLLQSSEYLVDSSITGEEAVKKARAFGNEYSLVLLDYRLGKETGEAVAAKLLAINPDLFVLIYSGDPSREAVKNTWSAGAVGFIEKGGSPHLFRSTVAHWCAKHRETKQKVSLSTALNENSESIAGLKMIGRSSRMADIATKVSRYKTLSDNVLVLGETGTGKEKIARALHGSSLPFLAVNCASYASGTELMEGELFGYEKGAFTGAIKDHAGVFEAAKGGTVFLDEVHTLSPVAQQKLLRVIQEKKVRRVGSTKETAVQFRLVAASKPDLESSQFLADLYERLNVLNITLPPLRERTEDIEPLVAYFTAQYEKETGEKKAFLVKTLRYLERYPWPRNVRELENTVRRLCVNVPGEKIEPEHLEAKFFNPENEPLPSLLSQKDELMKREIQSALRTSKSQREAARNLQLPESSLRRHMKRLGLIP